MLGGLKAILKMNDMKVYNWRCSYQNMLKVRKERLETIKREIEQLEETIAVLDDRLKNFKPEFV